MVVTKEQMAGLVKDYEAGKTRKELQDTYNLTPYRVSKIVQALKTAGIKAGERVKDTFDQDFEDVIGERQIELEIENRKEKEEELEVEEWRDERKKSKRYRRSSDFYRGKKQLGPSTEDWDELEERIKSLEGNS